MSVPKSPKLFVGRGLLAAGVAAIGSAALVPVLSFGYLICRWAVTKSTSYDREYDVNDLLSWLPRTTLACALLVGCSGWAAYGPSRKHSLAWTLILMAVATMGLGIVIGLFQFTPRRYKGIDHPFLYPSEAVFFFGIPVLVAIALTVFRIYKRTASSTEPVAAPDRGST